MSEYKMERMLNIHGAMLVGARSSSSEYHILFCKKIEEKRNVVSMHRQSSSAMCKLEKEGKNCKIQKTSYDKIKLQRYQS